MLQLLQCVLSAWIEITAEAAGAADIGRVARMAIGTRGGTEARNPTKEVSFECTCNPPHWTGRIPAPCRDPIVPFSMLISAWLVGAPGGLHCLAMWPEASKGRPPNRTLFLVLLAVTAMLGLTLLWPFARGLFRFGPLHVEDLAVALGAGIVVLVLLEVLKLLYARWRQSESRGPEVLELPR